MLQKFITIQYLRGLAAVMVLASHALLYPLAGHPLAFERLGWLGVVLFFVISGFIMVAVTGEGRFAPFDFLRRRAIRIVPMYWAATFLAASLALFLPHLFKTTVFDLGQLVQSLLFVPYLNPMSGEIQPLYKLGWTLNYEAFFYVCFALLAFLSAGQRVIWLTVGFTLLALIGYFYQPQPAIAQFYTNFMPLAFCAGAWLGLATLRGGMKRLSNAVLLGLAILGVAGLVEGFVTSLDGPVHDGLAFVGFLTFASAIVTLAVRFEPRLPRLALLEMTGDASYSIYLIHIFVVAVLTNIAFRVLDRGDILADYTVSAIAVTVGVAAGILTYRLAEKPLLDLMSGKRKRLKRAIVPAPAE